VVRPERLELPAYWFEANDSRGINYLAALLKTALFYYFQRLPLRGLVRVSNASEQGVGILLGIPDILVVLVATTNLFISSFSSRLICEMEQES